MRRRLNYRGLLILTVVAAVVGPGTFFLHRFQVRRNAEALYERAQATLASSSLPEREKLISAMDYLRRYLGFNPTDSDAYFEYANLCAHEKIATNHRLRFRAITILDQALRSHMTQDRDRDAERRRLIDLALEIRRFSDAQRHIDAMLAANRQSAE